MVIELSKLTGGYHSTPIVQEIDLSIERGEWFSLVGANGSGKSTLLKLINRILPTQLGAIYLNGKAIHQTTRQEIAQQLSFLPQQQLIPSGITVQQLVGLGRSPYQSWWQWELSGSDYQAINRALQLTQMQDLSNHRIEALSGGERQRAFLALAIAQEPAVLLLDEPTTYLDIRYQLELLELLKALQHEQGITIVTVLHDLNLAARYSDRLAMMKAGKLWSVGPTHDVLSRENIKAVFEIESEIVSTPIGPQIIPLTSPSHTEFPKRKSAPNATSL